MVRVCSTDFVSPFVPFQFLKPWDHLMEWPCMKYNQAIYLILYDLTTVGYDICCDSWSGLFVFFLEFLTKGRPGLLLDTAMNLAELALYGMVWSDLSNLNLY